MEEYLLVVINLLDSLLIINFLCRNLFKEINKKIVQLHNRSDFHYTIDLKTYLV